MQNPDSLPPPQPTALVTVGALSPSRRADGWSAERQRAFCEVLADTGRVDVAAGAAGLSRDAAYKFRNSLKGRAFAMAWDAALLRARQRLIDEAIELAFEGSVEQIIRDGKVIAERRKRNPVSMLATIERLGRPMALGAAPTRAIALEYEEFLDCMVADAQPQDGVRPVSRAGDFLKQRADWNAFNGAPLIEAGQTLHRALLTSHAQQEPTTPES